MGEITYMKNIHNVRLKYKKMSSDNERYWSHISDKLPKYAYKLNVAFLNIKFKTVQNIFFTSIRNTMQ